MSGARAAPWAACALLAGACGAAPPGPAYPGSLRSSLDLGGDFVLRQEVTVLVDGHRTRFEAVLQQRDGTLTLVGLTPFGTRAFAIVQRGRRVSVTTETPGALPLPPRAVLLDVHRTLFLGIDGAPLTEGWHEVERDHERVRERWRDGRLLERTFERLDGRARGVLRILYDAGAGRGRGPPTVRLHNPWLGYDLLVRTLPPVGS